MKRLFFILLPIMFFAASCEDDAVPSLTPPVGTGLIYYVFDTSPDIVYDNLINALTVNPNIGIVAEVNHQQNAMNNGLNLRYTREVFFGNPALGTPLMMENRLAGIDLPQKVVVYTSDSDESYLVYNSTRYLEKRHSLTAPSLEMISGALETLASDASGRTEFRLRDSDITAGEGIITVVSNRNFDETYTALVNAIDGNANLTIVAELDHQANAGTVNMVLPPTKLIMFGNPNLGTPLMENSAGTAIDLPQKMLIWEDSGTVNISYNDPNYIADRHDLTGVDEQLNMIAIALSNLANGAAGN